MEAGKTSKSSCPGKQVEIKCPGKQVEIKKERYRNKQ